MLDFFLLCFFPGLMIFAAASDISTMKIPNYASLSLIVGFFIIAFWSGLPLAAIGKHVLAGLAALAVGFILFQLRVLGGGDAKIIAATALWLSFADLGIYILSAAVVGGILAFGMVYFRQIPLSDELIRRKWIARLYAATQGVPYGVALALGGLCAYPFSPIWEQVTLAAI